MLTRKLRNLAITGITIVSATVLTTLAAVGASATTVAANNPSHTNATAATVVPAAPAADTRSAIPDSTNPKCHSDGSIIPWACVQVFGNGLIIDAWNGWAYVPATSVLYDSSSAHIELYYNSRGPYGPATHYSNSGHNCPGFTINTGKNSPNCSWPGASASKKVNAGYYCAAVWWYTDTWSDNYSCVYVH